MDHGPCWDGGISSRHFSRVVSHRLIKKFKSPPLPSPTLRRCEAENGHVEVGKCNEKPCPRPTDCKGRWESWSKCTHPCGGGTKTRKFKVIEPAIAGGTCEMRDAKETMECNEVPCPIPCHGGWSPWWGG